MLAALAGFAAGCFHVLAGPDHLAAVAPLAVSDDRAAWRSGLRWGVGHTVGVVAIGLLLLAFRDLLPLGALSAWSERVVGLALVAVGVWGLWRARRADAHTHSPAGASFGMGTLHGLAGSSHLYGVLPTLAFGARADGLLYLAGFGAGAIAAMTAFATMLGAVSLRAGVARRGTLRQALLYTSSAAAVVIGGAWLLA